MVKNLFKATTLYCITNDIWIICHFNEFIVYKKNSIIFVGILEKLLVTQC